MYLYFKFILSMNLFGLLIFHKILWRKEILIHLCLNANTPHYLLLHFVILKNEASPDLWFKLLKVFCILSFAADMAKQRCFMMKLAVQDFLSSWDFKREIFFFCFFVPDTFDLGIDLSLSSRFSHSFAMITKNA